MRPDKPILVVEDDPATRGALKRLLEQAGYRVDCAGDGRDALGGCRGDDVAVP